MATAVLPALLYERLDELGIDISVVYPSMGLLFMHFEDGDDRRARAGPSTASTPSSSPTSPIA